MTQVFDLTANQGGSRVLGAWLQGREGAMERAGIQAAGDMPRKRTVIPPLRAAA